MEIIQVKNSDLHEKLKRRCSVWYTCTSGM